MKKSIKGGIISAITLASLAGGIIGGEKQIPGYLNNKLNRNYLNDAQKKMEQVADMEL